MNYSQLREEIDKEFGKTQTAEDLLNGIMTAIDKYLEEKAVRAEKILSESDCNTHFAEGRITAAAIIRSKE